MGEPVWEGGCLCGAVRYRAQTAPLWIAHCHCASCRRHTGAALATFVGLPSAAFHWQGATGAYHSSPDVTRRFCPACGTPLSYESERWPGEVHVLVGTLDHPEQARPTAHVHTAERLPWLRIADGMPRFAGSGTSSVGPVGYEDD